MHYTDVLSDKLTIELVITQTLIEEKSQRGPRQVALVVGIGQGKEKRATGNAKKKGKRE